MFTRRLYVQGGSLSLHLLQLHAHIHVPAKQADTYQQGDARDDADHDPVLPGVAGAEGAVEGHEDAHEGGPGT